jgi:hypothetical protein
MDLDEVSIGNALLMEYKKIGQMATRVSVHNNNIKTHFFPGFISLFKLCASSDWNLLERVNL